MKKKKQKKIQPYRKEKLLELEEQLNLKVYVREALRNSQLVLLHRGRKVIVQLWKEVFEALNGKQNIYSINNTIIIRIICN